MAVRKRRGVDRAPKKHSAVPQDWKYYPMTREVVREQYLKRVRRCWDMIEKSGVSAYKLYYTSKHFKRESFLLKENYPYVSDIPGIKEAAFWVFYPCPNWDAVK